MTATTTQLEQTTVMLESLHTSYGAILEEAKAQLENIEMTSTDRNRLVEGLSNSSRFQSAVKRQAVDEMCERLMNSPEDATSQEVKLIDTLATAIGQKLGDGLQEQLDAKLKAFFESGAIESAIQASIDNNPVLMTALETKATLKQAFALAFDLDMDPEPAKASAESATVPASDDIPF